ncbi:uncharacterized protein LOC132750936 isoform X2 [Ruditapes philippinarum]|nr:uncharacterized protein LOC132750936 isoform X2 [Ruditapes philippinarum]
MGGCTLTPNGDARTGSLSMQVSNRDANWKGLAQFVNVDGGSRYKLTAFVKLLNIANNKTYQDVQLIMKCEDENETAKYMKFGKTPLVQAGQWYEVGGVRKINEGLHTCRFYVSTEAHTDYLVDDASLVFVTEDPDWRIKANDRIKQHRKADITVRMTGDYAESTSLDIELQQTKHEFIFGSVVRAALLEDDDLNLPYQKVFYENYEWSVLGNALKWKQMQRKENFIDYPTPLTAMNTLASKGILLRCHCAVWGVDERVPDWVKLLKGQDLIDAVAERIEGVVNQTKGLCEHWDVNNEMLHGDFFERESGNPDITMDMFRQIHKWDDHPTLFLNDYNVISNCDVAVAMKDTAVRFQQAGVPIGGIGVQGHMRDIDLTLVQARLDILAEADLPIVITEFAVNEINDTLKAEKLVDLMTIFFGHPSIDGVVFWGFWDGQIWEPEAAKFTGKNVEPNAAGLAYQELYQNTWRTRDFQTLRGLEEYTVTGFKGDYLLKVKHGGEILLTQEFQLSDEGIDLEIHLNGTSGGSPSVSHVLVS